MHGLTRGCWGGITSRASGLLYRAVLVTRGAAPLIDALAGIESTGFA